MRSMCLDATHREFFFIYVYIHLLSDIQLKLHCNADKLRAEQAGVRQQIQADAQLLQSLLFVISVILYVTSINHLLYP